MVKTNRYAKNRDLIIFLDSCQKSYLNEYIFSLKKRKRTITMVKEKSINSTPLKGGTVSLDILSLIKTVT